jgi:hypothetical protein
MNLAKSLNVSEKNYFNHRAPMQWNGSFWPKISPIFAFWLQRSMRYSKNKACCSFLLKESNYRPDRVSMGCTVNNVQKVWVYKLSFLKSHPSLQKGKKWNNAHFFSEKGNIPSVDSTPPHWLIQYRVSNVWNYRLSMDSNCRPQYKSFKLKLLKIWAILSIYTLS